MNQTIINYDFDNYDAIIVWHHNRWHDHEYYNALSEKLKNESIFMTHINYGSYDLNIFSINDTIKKHNGVHHFTLHTKNKDYDIYDNTSLDININFIKKCLYKTELMTLNMILKRPYYEMNLPKPLVKLILNML